MIDDTISWNYHLSYTCSRISRNTGIFLKLRHFLDFKQLKQLYYNLIYPYLSYAILAWGSACATHLKKIQVKQNHVIHLMFFATLYGKNTDSALPLLNLLDLLTVENIFIFRLLQFSHQWHKKSSLAFLITTFVMLVMFTHTTIDMLLKATSIKHASGLILEKQRCRLWQLTIGKNYHMKLKISIFPFSQEKLNSILLRKQMSS